MLFSNLLQDGVEGGTSYRQEMRNGSHVTGKYGFSDGYFNTDGKSIRSLRDQTNNVKIVLRRHKSLFKTLGECVNGQKLRLSKAMIKN